MASVSFYISRERCLLLPMPCSCCDPGTLQFSIVVEVCYACSKSLIHSQLAATKIEGFTYIGGNCEQQNVGYKLVQRFEPLYTCI